MIIAIFSHSLLWHHLNKGWHLGHRNYNHAQILHMIRDMSFLKSNHRTVRFVWKDHSVVCSGDSVCWVTWVCWQHSSWWHTWRFSTSLAIALQIAAASDKPERALQHRHGCGRVQSHMSITVLLPPWVPSSTGIITQLHQLHSGLVTLLLSCLLLPWH